MVFDTFAPYLKGFHLTLAQHLPKRDEDGWKLTNTEWIGYVNGKIEDGFYSQMEGDLLIDGMQDKNLLETPRWVVPVRRFWECLDVLLDFMKPEVPP